MSLTNLPEMKMHRIPAGIDCRPPYKVLSRWDGTIRSAGDPRANEIDIYDIIGSDLMGEGVTAKTVTAKLAGQKDIIVNINSPGGDVFEGIAIYNILRAHNGKVSVRVMGLAASAASVIAMAGDEILVAKAGFIMVHNAWVFAMGDRNDLAETIALLEQVDASLAEVYAARSGAPADNVVALMNAETWFDGKSAVEEGFADGLLAADQVKERADAKASVNGNSAMRRVDAALAAYGLPRGERRGIIKALRGMPGAAAIGDTPRAVPGTAGLKALHASLERLAALV